jgi:hydroxyacylglutathione hydrolase
VEREFEGEAGSSSSLGLANPEDEDVHFEQFYLGCLAHASYMLASEGEAVVVDPQRDVEIYLDAAAAHGARILHIFETHLHADFVSGHKELASCTGANIYIGSRANASFGHVDAKDGLELRVGKLRIQVLETPGHTPESVCLVVIDEEKSSNPWAILTGDTLFIGDVGRPDLSRTHTSLELAGMLYDSLHEKVLKLPDNVIVYPAHGAGSLCGRNMRSERSSTIGSERLTNHALQIKSREEFIHQLTTNLPSRPEYFLEDAELNRQGAGALSELPDLEPISAHELASALEKGAHALDVRPCDRFAVGHVPGSVNVALSGQFATWAAIVFGLSSCPIIIADTTEQWSEARLRLARVGIEKVRGYLVGGVEAWKQAGFPLAQIPQVSVQALNEWEKRPELSIVDVRREAEWQSGHIVNAVWIPLDKLASTSLPVGHDRLIAVHCQSGYRSMIACGLLRRAGFSNVINVIGGFDAWRAAGFPLKTSEEVAA